MAEPIDPWSVRQILVDAVITLIEVFVAAAIVAAFVWVIWWAIW